MNKVTTDYSSEKAVELEQKDIQDELSVEELDKASGGIWPEDLWPGKEAL